MNIAAPSDTAEPEATVAIRAFLKNYVKPLLPEIDKSTRFAAYAIPGTDVTIVFVSGFSWCGTGGCELLILRGGPSALKLMDSKPIVHPPIRVLNTQSAGLPDIGFWKGGGGGPSYEAVIHFNGKHYGPAKRLKGPPSGRIVIPDEKNFGILLYE